MNLLLTSLLLLLIVLIVNSCSPQTEQPSESMTIANEEIVREIIEEVSEEEASEDKAEEEPETCEEYGDFFIGNFCCKATPEVFLCGQDTETYKSRLEAGKKQSWPTPKQIVRLDNPEVSFQQPEGWKVMENYKSGIFDVPISYFIEEGNYFYEIRLLYYDKGNLNLKELEEALFKMISKRESLRGADKFHIYDIEEVWVEEVYEFDGDYCLKEYYECFSEDDYVYYEARIIPYNNKYYIWLYRDPAYRDYAGSKDKKLDQFSAILETFNFLEETRFEKEEQFKDDYVYYYSFDFEKPTTVKYDIRGDGGLAFYFLKDYDAFVRYLSKPSQRSRERFDFYEECDHYISTKEVEGECTITTGGLMIASNKDGFNNINIDLDWSGAIKKSNNLGGYY